MGINIGSNFSYNGKLFLDARQSFATLEEMNAFPSSSVPEGFITFCQEDGKRYEFRNNEWIIFTVNVGTNDNTGGSTITEEDIERINAELLTKVDVKLEDYATKAHVDTKLEDYATKVYVDEALDNVILNEGTNNDCSYFGDEEPEDDEQIWFSDSTSSVSSGITYDNPVINELFACIRTLQDQVKKLQEDVEYLKINGGGGSGDWPDIPEIVVDSFLALEDGGIFLLEDGGQILLEEVVEVAQESRLALEDGDLFLMEDGSYILLEEQVIAIKENLMLLEDGAQLLLESGYNILMEQQ